MIFKDDYRAFFNEQLVVNQGVGGVIRSTHLTPFSNWTGKLSQTGSSGWYNLNKLVISIIDLTMHSSSCSKRWNSCLEMKSRNFFFVGAEQEKTFQGIADNLLAQFFVMKDHKSKSFFAYLHSSSHSLSLSLYLLSIFNWIHWNPKTWTQKRQIAAESVETEIAGNEVFDRSLNGGDKKESGSDVE